MNTTKPRSARVSSTSNPMLPTAFASRGFPMPTVEPVAGGFRAFTVKPDGNRAEALGWCEGAAVRELARLVNS